MLLGKAIVRLVFYLFSLCNCHLFETFRKCFFALLPIYNSLPRNNFATSKVSSPGTIALTTGVPTSGLVKSTIIALLNPAFFNRFKISLISSKMSFCMYVLISENLTVFPYFLN